MVQYISSLEFLVRIKMEPAHLICVPGDIEDLKPTLVELDQVLLQGRDADGVFDLKQLTSTVRPLRFDEKLAVALGEFGLDAPVFEDRIVEIAENVLGTRHSQGPAVMRV